MNFMVNAGIIPKDVWVHDPEVGGGRIIGEACHFIDLLSYVCGSKIVSVASAQMGKGVAVKEEKMSIVLSACICVYLRLIKKIDGEFYE